MHIQILIDFKLNILGIYDLQSPILTPVPCPSLHLVTPALNLYLPTSIYNLYWPALSPQ